MIKFVLEKVNLQLAKEIYYWSTASRLVPISIPDMSTIMPNDNK
jgi:hypothetical protein